MKASSCHSGSFDTVRALVRHIQAYLDHWNEHPVPLVWTKMADQISFFSPQSLSPSNLLPQPVPGLASIINAA